MKRSLFFYIGLIFLVLSVNFFLPRMLPNSPIARIAGEQVGEMSAAEREQLLEAYHLNDPLPVQFKKYLVDAVTLNWGTSYTKHQEITTLIGQALPWTLLLSVSNLILSTVIGCYFGYRSAIKRKEKKDLKYMMGISALSSLPLFWVGMTFIAIFSVSLKWFPLAGAYSLWENYTGLRWLVDVIWHMTLPLMTLVSATVLTFFISMRYGVLTILSEDYIRMARLRGLSKRRIQFTYVIKNAAIPVLTTFMLEFGFILSGSIVIETLFSYPGIGKLMYDGVMARDYPLVQYAFVIVSLMTIFANFLADILYSKVDVRMAQRYE